MSIFSWLIGRKAPSPAARPGPINVSGLSTIPVKCPTCGQVGDFRLDPNAHDFFGLFQVDPDTALHVLECPYCRAGMLLCLRGPQILFIEGYRDDSPVAMLDAVKRATARLKG